MGKLKELSGFLGLPLITQIFTEESLSHFFGGGGWRGLSKNTRQFLV
jgi:hypothetical protein